MQTGSAEMIKVATDEREQLWVMGSMLEIIITGDQTGGVYALAEDRSNPGFGPPPHIHSNEDEVFYVLEGEYAFGSEDAEVRGGPGTVVHAPRGQLHWWRNVGDGPGRHLEIFLPAGLEKFFQEIGQPVADPDTPPAGPPDPRRLLEAAPRYGLEFRLPNDR